MTIQIMQNVIPVEAIHPHPRNFREHPESQIAQLEASYERFGQFRSIVVQVKAKNDYLLVAGHGIFDAMKRKGATQVRADVLPTALSPAEVEAIMIADNLLPQLANDDEVLLARLLQEQQEAGYDLRSLGTDEETLRQMLANMGDERVIQDELDDTDSDEEDRAAEDTIFNNEIIAAEAFKYFRNTGFPYRKLPVFMCMQELNKLAHVDTEHLINSTLAYHIADTYHPHRVHSSAESMKSPIEAFHDDTLLMRAFSLYQQYGQKIPIDLTGVLNLVSGTQACANFRPGFALHLYRKYCKPGAIVLDTSTGYGGRLVGFIASGLAGCYIGIDPSTETHQANLRMAADLCFTDKIELYNRPAEDVPHEQVADRCDFAFTSPPYFAKEHYSDEETQSWKRYQTGDAWRASFLQKMIALQFVALKPGSYAIVNIADVTLRGKTYPLVRWTIEDGKAVGFEYLRTEEYPLTRRFGAGQEEGVATESVIVFRKGVK